MPQHKKMVTYKVSGGSIFSVHLEGNPPIEHNGAETVGHLYISVDQLSQLQAEISKFGSNFSFWEMEKQTAEQKRERVILLGAFEDSSVFPNIGCPNCPWFDPLVSSFCGRKQWPQESIKVLLSTEPHTSFLKKCTSPQVWQTTIGGKQC